MKPTIGVIGGSGLYSMPGFEAEEEVPVKTPFGAPSDNYIVGRLEGKEVAFLSRHGRGHRFSPSEVNFRANVWGMKSLGVERILSLSAVGSLNTPNQPQFEGMDTFRGPSFHSSRWDDTVDVRGKAMATGNFAPAFEMAMARKDLRLMLETAAGAPLCLLPALAARLDEAIAEGHGREDVGAIAAGRRLA